MRASADTNRFACGLDAIARVRRTAFEHKCGDGRDCGAAELITLACDVTVAGLSLTLWLLVMGVDVARWKDPATAAAAAIRT